MENLVKNVSTDLLKKLISIYLNCLYFVKINFFEKFLSLLILILPFMLITGPAIPDMIISILGLSFLLISINKKLWKYYSNPIVIGSLIFCLYSTFISIISEYPILSLKTEGSVFYFRYIFFIMSFCYLIKKNPWLLKCFTFSMIFSMLIVLIDSIFQYIFDFNFFGYPILKEPIRITSFFKDEAIAGRFLFYTSSITICLIHYIFTLSKKTNLFINLIFILVILTVYLSGERAPFFQIFLFFLIFILITQPSFKIKFLLIFFSFISLIFINFLSPSSTERMIKQTYNQVNSTEIFKFLPISPHHEEHFMGALKMSKNNLLFGVGTNLYRYYCDKKQYSYKQSCSTHPHNIYLQLLAELGVVGLVFLVLFYLYIAYSLVHISFNDFIKEKYVNKKNKITLFLLLTVVIFIPILPSMSFYNNWNNIFIYIALVPIIKNFYYQESI